MHHITLFFYSWINFILFFNIKVGILMAILIDLNVSVMVILTETQKPI